MKHTFDDLDVDVSTVSLRDAARVDEYIDEDQHVHKLRDAKSYEVAEIQYLIDSIVNRLSIDYEQYLKFLEDLYSKVLKHRPVSGFKTERTILQAYKQNDLYIDIVFGRQGIGKSSYALRLAFYVYRSWTATFLHLFYDPLQLLQFMQFLRKYNLRAPLVIVDDAGVLFGRHIYLLDRKRYFAMRLIFDLARAHISAMIFTVPSINELTHLFRIANVVVTKIYRQDHLYRIAVKYAREVLPSGCINVRKLFMERYNVRLPDNVYRLYTKLRNNYIDIMMKLIEKPSESEEEDV